MRRSNEAWASDVPISRPVAPDREVLVDFLGFGFTTGGMVLNATDSEIEELFMPPYMPEGYEFTGDDEDEVDL